VGCPSRYGGTRTWDVRTKVKKIDKRYEMQDARWKTGEER